MSGAMTFRSECKLCSEVFFGPVKETPYCARCAKRIGYRSPKSPSRPPAPGDRSSAPAETTPAARPVAPSPRSAPAARHVSDSNAATSLRANTSSITGASSKTAVPARPAPSSRERGAGDGRDHVAAGTEKPASARISESLRRSIEHAYEYYAGEPGTALKDINERICLEFGLDRQVVHEITARLHGAHLRQQSAQLTPEQRKEIGDRYHRMIELGARPSGGRRRQIAKEMGIPQTAVILQVGQWRIHHNDPRQLSRAEKFRIEKAYSRHVQDAPEGSRIALQELSDQLARDLNLPEPAVMNWIDQLHDDLRPLNHIPPIPVETTANLERAYREYLSADAPPDDALHHLLAESYGCTVRQAHRALLIYRWRERLAKMEHSEEETRMLHEAEEAAKPA